MTPTRLLPALALLTLAACATPTVDDSGAPLPLEELPEGLAEAAAPGQNLEDVIILPEDGCYWYLYVGPVETTRLPLRTPAGRPICSRPRP